MLVQVPPACALVRQRLSGLWLHRPAPHAHGETTAQAPAGLAARARICFPWPGICCDAQVRPPSVVRNSSGAKAQPAAGVANRMSVMPGLADCPCLASGALTVPIRPQLLPALL